MLSFIGPAVFGWLAAELTLWYEAQGQAVALAEQSGHRLAVLSIDCRLFDCRLGIDGIGQ